MAGDPIVGNWVVTHFQSGLAKFKFRYRFTAAGAAPFGSVQWQDYWDGTSNGSGTWKRSGGQINIDWPGSSTTKEYLVMAPTVNADDASGEATASYGTFSTVAKRDSPAGQAAGGQGQDLMQQWAADPNLTSPFINPNAIPYPLKLSANHPLYKQSQMGGPIGKINGLAIHTTWSPPSLSLVATVGMCINVWNASTVKTGAHFIIGSDGTLVQVVPTNRIAYAQGGNGDRNWLSVEVQTLNSAANAQQLQTATALFQWVANTYGVEKKLASGYIGAYDPKGSWVADAKRDYDPITKSICGDDVTSNIDEAIGSTGLSCHYWLHPAKPCPGKPLLAQLKQIAGG